MLIALRQTLSSLRLVWLMYGVTLALGLLVAIPFYKTVLAESQNSLALLNLLPGFNFTVFTDFMQRSSRTLTPLLSVGRWIGLLYVALSVFFAGGILARFEQLTLLRSTEPFHIGQFLQNCTHYVARFLGLFGVTLVFVIVGGAIWLIAGTLAAIVLDDTLTERGQFWIGLVFFILFALTVTFLLCIGDYAKVIMVREDEPNPIRAFGRAGGLVIRYVGKTYGIYCLFLLIGAFLFGIYFVFDALINMGGWITILLLFLIQQAFIFTRIGLKVWSLGTAYTIYNALPKPRLALPMADHVAPIQESTPTPENPSPTID